MKTNILLLISLAFISFTFTSCIQEGCTDPTAKNYNEKANKDDGSCYYKDEVMSGDWQCVQTSELSNDTVFYLSKVEILSYPNNSTIRISDFGDVLSGDYFTFDGTFSSGTAFNFPAKSITLISGLSATVTGSGVILTNNVMTISYTFTVMGETDYRFVTLTKQ